MAPAPPWSDLTGELVVCIANAHGVSLRDYTCLRGVCTAWRSALNPPYPCLLSLADDEGRYSASVFSLPMQRPFHLHTMSSSVDDGRHDHDRRTPFSEVRARVVSSSKPSEGCSSTEVLVRVVGSSNGRFAVTVDDGGPHFLYCRTRRIFLLDPRAGKEVELGVRTAPLNCESGGPCREYVHKVVFPPGPDDGTVVALCDHKYVAYMDVATSREYWTIIDVVTSNKEYLADLAFGDDGKLYCLDGSNGSVHVVRIPRRGCNESDVVEHLSAAFAPPYDIWSALAYTKYVFFFHGSLYQVWRNKSVAVTKGGFTMSEGEIFVLRYDPGRWPCWDVVKDLGGCSVFIGKKSSPAVVRAAGVPGVRPDCVYWIDWMRPMVCDIATGVSKPCVLPNGACRGNCWYFGNDMAGIDIVMTHEYGEKLKRTCV